MCQYVVLTIRHSDIGFCVLLECGIKTEGEADRQTEREKKRGTNRERGQGWGQVKGLRECRKDIYIMPGKNFNNDAAQKLL